MRRLILGVLVALAMAIGACAPNPQNLTQGNSVEGSQLAALPSTEVGAYQGPVNQRSEFRWRLVGADPCNPAVGCTLAFALERFGWPQTVRQAFTRIVREQGGREVTITRGWRGGMTWGSQTPKYHPNTVAEFSLPEPAQEWTYVHEGTEYVLVRINRCRNWGGNTRAPTPTQPTRPTIPSVACP
jgi:hypothetical protein